MSSGWKQYFALVSEGLTLPAAIARVSKLGNRGAPLTGEGEALLFGQILQNRQPGPSGSPRDGTPPATFNRQMAQLMGCSVDDLLGETCPRFPRPRGPSGR